MEFKGTKGNWFACCENETPHFIFSENGYITICKPYQEQQMSDDLTDEEFRANAKLIASAPKMFNALSDFVQTSNKQGVLNVEHYKELFTELLTKITE